MQTYEESLDLFVRVVHDAASRTDVELLISLWKETSVLPYEHKKEVRKIFDGYSKEIAQDLGFNVNAKSFLYVVDEYDRRRIKKACKKNVVAVKDFVLQCNGNRIAWFFLHHFRNSKVPESVLVDTLWIAIDKFRYNLDAGLLPSDNFFGCVSIVTYVGITLTKSLPKKKGKDLEFYTEEFVKKCVQYRRGDYYVIWFKAFSLNQSKYILNNTGLVRAISPILTKNDLTEMFHFWKSYYQCDLLFSEFIKDKVRSDITIINDFVKAGCSENLKYDMIQGLF